MTDYSYLSEKTRDAVTRAYRLSKQMHYATITPLAMMVAIAEECREPVADRVRRMGLDMSAFCSALASALPLSGHNLGAAIPISNELDSFLETAVAFAQEHGGLQATPVHVFQVLATHPGETRNVILSLNTTDERIRSAFLPESQEVSSPPKSLMQYATDLTKAAADGKLEPVIGRDKEILRLMQILLRKTKNNPVLVGPAGTGKTAVAEGLAQRIVSGNAPSGIKGLRVYSLDIPALVAGAGIQGEFEDRLKQVMKEAKEHPEIVLFIDEIHLLVGTGGRGGTMDAANILKPALSRGEIRVIGATTTEEYTRFIESDKAFERRFQKINVEEPDEESAVAILKGIKERFEAFHGISIREDAIKASVILSRRYLCERCLPDKAIDLLDEAASRLKMDSADDVQGVLTEDHIRNVVTAWTGIPLTRLQGDETERLSSLEQILSESIIGQSPAVNAVSRVIRRNKMGLGDPGRPIGSFLFLGPTGVGKTALAKALAEYLFSSTDMMVRIDMSEYQQEHTVSRLFGAPPGYVGFDQGGQLTEAVRHRPFSVVLLDEIEKAHAKVFETLLQVLDDGRMTDGQGRTVNFRNTIIIMTSNLREEQLKTRMSPEFLNRIDDTIVFNNLGEKEVYQIGRQQMNSLRERMLACDIQMEYNDDVLRLLCKMGFSREYGARSIKRTINHFIVDGLASALMGGDVLKDFPITISASNDTFTFHNENSIP